MKVDQREKRNKIMAPKLIIYKDLKRSLARSMAREMSLPHTRSQWATKCSSHWALAPMSARRVL